jgi:hypothetical protein
MTDEKPAIEDIPLEADIVEEPSPIEEIKSACKEMNDLDERINALEAKLSELINRINTDFAGPPKENVPEEPKE